LRRSLGLDERSSIGFPEGIELPRQGKIEARFLGTVVQSAGGDLTDNQHKNENLHEVSI